MNPLDHTGVAAMLLWAVWLTAWAIVAGCLAAGLGKITRREMPAPPPVPRHDDPCSVLHCDQPGSKGIHGWRLCAGHHEAISGRAPFDQEAS